MRLERPKNAVDDGSGTGRVNRGLRAGKPKRGGEHTQSALRALTHRSTVFFSAGLILAAVELPAALSHSVRCVNLLRVFVNAQRHHRRSQRRERQPQGKKHSQQFAKCKIHHFILA